MSVAPPIEQCKVLMSPHIPLVLFENDGATRNAGGILWLNGTRFKLRLATTTQGLVDHRSQMQGPAVNSDQRHAAPTEGCMDIDRREAVARIIEQRFNGLCQKRMTGSSSDTVFPEAPVPTDGL